MLLADKLVERARAHAIGQWTRLVDSIIRRRVGLEQIHGFDFTTEDTESTENQRILRAIPSLSIRTLKLIKKPTRIPLRRK